MDSHCGKEEEAMDCVLESAVGPPTSQCARAEDLDRKLNVIAGDESLTERKIDATFPKSTDAATHYTELASETISETIQQNLITVVGANMEAANEESAYDSPGSSTLSALDECNETTGGKSVGNTSYVCTETTTILSGIATNTKFDIVNNNSSGMKVKSTVDESNDASCGGSAESATDINVAVKKSCPSGNDAVIGRITVLTINEEETAGGKLIAGTERNDDALMACSDPTPKKETNDTFREGITKCVEGVDLHDMKHTIPPNCEMDFYSDKSVQPSKKRDSDSHYDSEIEIIDCTSESLDGQPVAGRNIPSNPSSVAEEFPLDNTPGIVKMSGSGITKALSKIPRNKKRERYLLRCENLRRFRLKRQLGEIIQPSQSKSRVSSHSLEKLTKNNLKFMENFDPKMSNRERRKMMRKKNIKRHLRGEVYGENGELLSCGKNLCDCMNIDCPGCHFPCPRCQSPKCGHECRVNRKWTYEEIEIDGTDIVIRPHEIIEGFLHDNQ